MPSNHPIVELKPVTIRDHHGCPWSSNHPIVELKHDTYKAVATNQKASNHPIVELKLRGQNDIHPVL